MFEAIHQCVVNNIFFYISEREICNSTPNLCSDYVGSWKTTDEATPFWKKHNTWWRHQMETFSALPAICAGTSPVPGEFPTQRPVTRSFDVCFDLRLNKRLSKQSWGCWFETLSRPLWHQCNDTAQQLKKQKTSSNIHSHWRRRKIHFTWIKFTSK